jgi:hypothetical protein
VLDFSGHVREYAGNRFRFAKDGRRLEPLRNFGNGHMKVGIVAGCSVTSIRVLTCSGFRQDIVSAESIITRFSVPVRSAQRFAALGWG